jgi:ABC-type nitrate/sulfonate/bicarbonate transport system permease component
LLWLSGFVLLFALWNAAAAFHWVGKSVVASPSEVWQQTILAFSRDATTDDKFHLHLLATVKRALIGWSLSVAVGVAFALVTGIGQFVRFVSEPALELFRAIPPVLVFPLFLVAYNQGDQAYIVTIVFGCVPIMILTISSGIARVNPTRMEMLAAFGAGPAATIKGFVLELAPSFVLGSRLCFSTALIVAIVIETVQSPPSGWGLGNLARDALTDFRTPLVYVCFLAAGLVGFIVNMFLSLIENRLRGKLA